MDNQRSTIRIANVLRQLSPDIVCFQEIHQRMPISGGEDQPAWLSRYLSRPILFQRNLRVGPGNYGVAVAVRGTISETKEHKLPSVGEQRGALEVRLQGVPGIGRLTVFCTHWGLDPEERVRQSEALVAAIRAARSPIIVCGDLNEGADATGVRALIENSGLINVDANLNRPTFPAIDPTVRINFVLCSSDLTVQQVEVINTQASDHLPLLVDVSKR